MKILSLATVVATLLAAADATTATDAGNATNALCNAGDTLTDAQCNFYCQVDVDKTAVTTWTGGAPTLLSDVGYMYHPVVITDTTDDTPSAGNVGGACASAGCHAVKYVHSTTKVTIRFATCVAGTSGNVDGGFGYCPTDHTNGAADSCSLVPASSSTGNACITADCTTGTCDVTLAPDVGGLPASCGGSGAALGTCDAGVCKVLADTNATCLAGTGGSGTADTDAQCTTKIATTANSTTCDGEGDGTVCQFTAADCVAGPCHSNASVATDGTCTVTPKADGTACNDGDSGTTTACLSGVCQAVSCDDGVTNGDEEATDCGGSVCSPCLECPTLDSTNFATTGTLQTSANFIANMSMVKCPAGSECYLYGYAVTGDSTAATQYVGGCVAPVSGETQEETCTALQASAAGTGYTYEADKSACPSISCPTAVITSDTSTLAAEADFNKVYHGCLSKDYKCFHATFTATSGGVVKMGGGCLDTATTTCSAKETAVTADTYTPAQTVSDAFCDACQKTVANGSCTKCACTCSANYTASTVNNLVVCTATPCSTSAPNSGALPLVDYASTTGDEVAGCVLACVTNATKGNDGTNADPKCACDSGYSANDAKTACEKKDASGSAALGTAIASLAAVVAVL